MTMTTHLHTEAYRRGDRSPEALEHELDAERTRIAATIDELEERISVNHLMDEAIRSVGAYSGEIGRGLGEVGRSFGRRARENPLPLLLTGVGIAWLMASSRNSRHPAIEYDYSDEEYLWDVEEDELYDDPAFVGTRRYGAADTDPYGTRYEGPEWPEWEDERAPETTMPESSGLEPESISESAGSTGSTAARGEGTRYGTGSVSHGASRAAGAAAERGRSAMSGVSKRIGSAASAVTHGASRAGESIGRGASWAQRRAARYGGSPGRRIGGMMEEQPLVMGALAFAVGAAIGGALPRTRVEDEYLGDYSDGAMDALRSTAREEAEKARRVGAAVADEARDIARESAENLKHRASEARHAGSDAVHEAAHEARDAAGRLRDRAAEEAKKEDLGNPDKRA